MSLTKLFYCTLHNYLTTQHYQLSYFFLNSSNGTILPDFKIDIGFNFLIHLNKEGLI